MEIDQIYVHDIWLGVGGNTPWGMKGNITEIELNEPDPRNFHGADSAFIFIKFDTGYIIKMKTNNYMIGYQGDSKEV
ncbi:hypothetical protein [Virgibacillus salexigens]|uniref:hypothetical protein n=1 Tax=Virgibacillus salexigens TaxID=61016 RepID=UPI00190B1118|nr:hypothetical protein [Virgibacillus salexigens]